MSTYENFDKNGNTNMNFYNPYGIKFIYINQLFKELNLNKLVGWKLLIHPNKWSFNVENQNMKLKEIVYIGKGLKIFRNHTQDMNNWKISEQDATEFKRRFKTMNIYLKAKVTKINKEIKEIENKIKEKQNILNRIYLKKYLNQKIVFTGTVDAVYTLETYDSKNREIINIIKICVIDIITEHGDYIDHINASYPIDIYNKYYKNICVGNKVKCVGIVTKYRSFEKYGIFNINMQKLNNIIKI